MFTPYACDLKPFLPEDWVQQVNEVSKTAPRVTKQPGPGSLTLAEAGGGLDYLHHTSEVLIEQIPWIGPLFLNAVPALLEAALGEVYTPISGPEGLSLNVLMGDSTRKGLEWHVDGPDVACNLILSNGSWTTGTGGRFLTHDGRTVREYEIKAGVGLVVPTGKMPHSVEPLLANSRRVTMMFAYTTPQLQETYAAERKAQELYNAGKS